MRFNPRRWGGKCAATTVLPGQNILDESAAEWNDSRRELEGYFRSPEDAPPKWLLMLRAYIDESGHESKGWMFIAGYLGNEEQWQDFVPKWKAALGQRKFLHMKELRWKKESTKRLLERLGPIPEACGLEGAMCGVRYQDYEDLVTGTAYERLIKGYIACLIPMVIQILRGIPKHERLELFLEEQRQYAPFADMALGLSIIPGHQWTTTTDGRPKLARWGFVPKGSTIMTDPADYLAFALRETWTDRKSRKAEWCRPILMAGRGEGYGVVMNRDMIRRVVMRSQMLAIYDTIDQQLRRVFKA